jgi:hypothetical protein
MPSFLAPVTRAENVATSFQRRNSLLKEHDPRFLFIAWQPPNLFPAVNDTGDSGVTHIGNHDDSVLFCFGLNRRMTRSGYVSFTFDGAN